MLDERLIEAYRATDYVLFVGDGPMPSGKDVTLNIGRRNPDFDAVLDRRGATTAVVVTAYNPRSIVLADAENRARHAQLTAWLEARGYDYALGEGRDPTGAWKAELECVVFGIPVEAGLEIARRFDQNAIVFIERGGVPELAYPEDGS
jgi:ribose 1,5-bisphosphokinase PhnN